MHLLIWLWDEIMWNSLRMQWTLLSAHYRTVLTSAILLKSQSFQQCLQSALLNQLKATNSFQALQSQLSQLLQLPWMANKSSLHHHQFPQLQLKCNLRASTLHSLRMSTTSLTQWKSTMKVTFTFRILSTWLNKADLNPFLGALNSSDPLRWSTLSLLTQLQDPCL